MPEPSLTLDERGWMRGIEHIRSPNFDARPHGETITLVVIHGISLPPGQFGTGCVERLFTNCLDSAADPSFEQLQALRVSSHFLIGRSGTNVQFVSCNERAWHAGASSFGGRSRCNDFSLGIELEGTDELPYEDVQYRSLNALLTSLVAAYPVRAVVGHSDIAPGRKTDPGPCFDWFRLPVDLRLHA